MCQPWVWGRDNFKLNSLLLRPFYNNGHGDGSDDFEPDFKRLVPEGRWRVIFERDCQQLPPFHCVSTKGVVLRKGNTGECNYTHSCFYQKVHSLVEMVIGDARKLDKCLCQFLLSPCASFKWFFTHEFKKHWGVHLDWLQYTKHLIGSAQNQPTANWKDIYWDRLGMPQRNFNNTLSRGSKIHFRYSYPLVMQSTQPIKWIWDQTGEG